MSMFDSDDLGMPGYFLPEDSQFRLKKLRNHVVFLSRLAQPRTWDEEQEAAPEVSMGEVAVCLELLAEQVGQVLEAASGPARRVAGRNAVNADAEAELVPHASQEAEAGLVFGVTLAQVETLHRLIDMLSDHGDATTAHSAHDNNDAGDGAHTRSLPGHAIVDGAMAVRGIVRQIEAQPLAQETRSAGGVGEERAGYDVGPVRIAADSACGPMPPPLAHRWPQRAETLDGMRLH